MIRGDTFTVVLLAVGLQCCLTVASNDPDPTAVDTDSDIDPNTDTEMINPSCVMTIPCEQTVSPGARLDSLWVKVDDYNVGTSIVAAIFEPSDASNAERDWPWQNFGLVETWRPFERLYAPMAPGTYYLSVQAADFPQWRANEPCRLVEPSESVDRALPRTCPSLGSGIPDHLVVVNIAAPP